MPFEFTSGQPAGLRERHMTVQTRGHQQPVSRPTKPGYTAPVLAALASIALLTGLLAYSEENIKPGYSTVSQLLRSSEAVATAKKAAEDRSAAERKRSDEAKAAREKREEDIRSILSITRKPDVVRCSRPQDWTNLKPEEQQRLRDLMKKYDVLFIESDACPQ